MPERVVKANGLEIWCEDFGDPADPALLLIMGAGAQAIHWPEPFCQALAAAKRYVIRYDNRDVGQSTCIDFSKHPYTINDMALDALGVLDAFGVERAHVVGASMGGMIAQSLAIEHRERLRTLTVIMSSPCSASLMPGMITGEGSGLPTPEPKVLEVIRDTVKNPPKTTDARIELSVRLWRALTGSGESYDETAVRTREAKVQARSRNPDASQNHTLAIAASPDRITLLHGVTTPTLVIHGSEDPILPLPHGRAVAEAIPNAQLAVIEKMGHELPPMAAKRIAEMIINHTA